MLLSKKARAKDVHSIFEALINYSRQAGFKKILLKTIPYIFYEIGSQEDLYFIFNKFYVKIFRRDLSSVIYLNHEHKLSKGRKWLIARAKKLNLSVTSSTDWLAFHALLKKTLERYSAEPIHSVEELIKLSTMFPENIKLKVVKKEGELLSAALLFIFNGVVHTQYLANSDQGFKYFSFGTSTENQGKTLNMGLIAQKESFWSKGIGVRFL